mgnify:CR=1 FL=1
MRIRGKKKILRLFLISLFLFIHKEKRKRKKTQIRTVENYRIGKKKSYLKISFDYTSYGD